MKNLLVTGAGAVLGQGILRCINEKRELYRVHTADPDRRSTGHWLGDKAHIIPFANDKEYMPAIEKIIENENIDALLIGTDVELPIFSKEKERLESKYGLKVIVSNQTVIDIANDKWKTADVLKSMGLPYPYSFLSTDKEGVEELVVKGEYPYIAKPIDGARSKGVVLIKNKHDLDEVTSYPNNLVIQEFLSEEQGEFTSGCVVVNGKAQAVVTLKRDLRDGNTYRAYYETSFEEYTPFIKEFAERLGVEGPCNFQFRIKNSLPVIFEINSRFSGTTPIRSFFGFNEVTSLLDFIFNGKTIEAPILKEGSVLRAWADIFVDKETSDKFSKTETMENLTAVYHPFIG